ncbi:hypothetical protein amrb99_21370 [Actinomadura sp. RB99]|uniref:hypothetical protein n=1 Tax=Actinomadura sp. RB99 TaxID=2691577 RepID=UPI0019AA204C|nr:hypothetical protein [Actinomadura sp. RB99]MBD2893216.1 hypothetical protein [Actinomadura sp. RB99]
MLRATDEMLVLFDGLAGSDEIVFKAIAAPVFDPTARALLALSITGSGEPVRVDRVLALGRRLVRAAGIATRRSRGRVPCRDALRSGTEPAGAFSG